MTFWDVTTLNVTVSPTEMPVLSSVTFGYAAGVEESDGLGLSDGLTSVPVVSDGLGLSDGLTSGLVVSVVPASRPVVSDGLTSAPDVSVGLASGFAVSVALISAPAVSDALTAGLSVAVVGRRSVTGPTGSQKDGQCQGKTG